MSSPPRKIELLPPGTVWLLTGLGLILVPAGLFLADKVSSPWWTAGLWISASGSACLLWGLTWALLRRARIPLDGARGIAAALALGLVVSAFLIATGAAPKKSVDLTRILLDSHRFAAGLILVLLAADRIHTASRSEYKKPLFWMAPLVLAATGLFGMGWVLDRVPAWRFPGLVALGALPFLVDYLIRRPPLEGR